MISTEKVISLRTTLLTLSIGLVSGIILLSSYFSATLFIDTSTDQLIKNTAQWARVTAERSAQGLSSNNEKLIEQKLSALKFTPAVHYIHIYKVSSVSTDVKFFTNYSYDSSFPPLQDKIDSIDYLSIPRVLNGYIEYITPINHNAEVIGYVYIRTSTENIRLLRNNIIMVTSIMLLIIILVTVMLVLKLEQLLTASVNKLSKQQDIVIKEKDYRAKCEPLTFKEFNVLSYQFNILMQRTHKHIKKLQDEKDAALVLNHELEDKVNSRTDALKESNQELLSTLEKLHQYQDQLVESEKMASLGDMVAGVAHEVNTPIGLGVTASTLLADKLSDIKTAFENKSLRSSQLKKFLDDGQENIDIVFRNLNRAANLISSFKKVSVNQSADDICTFNVEELLNEVLLTLAPQIKNTPYNIVINCPSDLSIDSNPGPLNQVLINLIFNSILHGFEGQEEGRITISVMTLGSQLHIQYQDDGVGMSSEFKAKAFDPFTTTKRGSGGSGLGLHLVYNLVTQGLGGTISLESEKGKGVTFDINFPI